jgi:hypothetical protein
MLDAKKIAGRVEAVRLKNAYRDMANAKLIAIRRGDYEAVAPGLFNTADFDRPLIANLIDTTARDLAEVFAPLPSIACQSASLSSDSDSKRQDKRSAIANYYVQNSRLQDQMFGGADRFGSFGFMAYMAQADFKDRTPVIRIDDNPSAYYTRDYRGRICQYFSVSMVRADELYHKFPEHNLPQRFENSYGSDDPTRLIEVVQWQDDDATVLLLTDPALILDSVPNPIGKCLVRVVERPSVVADDVRGQFDDVIWVQIARALVQNYTLNALEQSVNAPLQVPKDVTEMEIGPFAAIQTDGTVQRVNLGFSPGLFPEFATLAQEQRMGSRYPEGRSGSIDASVITGQGVQALMGTFDTQVQTFQRLNASALEDVICLCFELDEAYWGNTKKTIRVKESGAPRKLDYVPNKDINGDYTVDVSYGAIAGLDPNRALVFVLQALAGGLVSKHTAMKTLPVELNVLAEERQIQLEQMDSSIAASIAALPQAIPQMTMNGMDPRELVSQVAELHDLMAKGISPSEAVKKVFAPPEAEQPPAEPSPDDLLAQAGGAGAGPAGMPGAGSGGASDLMMMLAGVTPGGNSNLQANVSRMRPVQG